MSLAENELKRFEEEKRDAAWDPVERWRMILRAITWAESLPNVRRNTPQRCHELEQVKNSRPPPPCAADESG